MTLTTGLALLLALWLNRKSFFHGFVQGAIFSPHIISLVSISLLWSWLMDPEYGLLNWVIGLAGFGKLEWLSDPSTSLVSLVIVAVWKGLGYNTLVFIAGLQSIPPDIYEAASLDRSKPWTTFSKLILPMLSPSIFFLVIINMIGSFQAFETIAIMTQGGPGEFRPIRSSITSMNTDSGSSRSAMPPRPASSCWSSSGFSRSSTSSCCRIAFITVRKR